MDDKNKLVKKENENLEKIDGRPNLLVNDIAKLVNSSTLSKPHYKGVKIGNQIWMLENLNIDHYRNGDPIPEVRDPERWGNLKTGAWCWYDNNMKNVGKYGKLYNWYAVNDPRGLAPIGWHIPTKAELETLMATVGNDGNKLKSKDQGTGNGVGTNTSELSSLLAGTRYGNSNFSGLGYYTYFWSSEEYDVSSAYYLALYYSDSSIYMDKYNNENGFSIRCVKD